MVIWNKALGITAMMLLAVGGIAGAQETVVVGGGDGVVDDTRLENLIVELGGFRTASECSGTACAVACADGSCCAANADSCPEGSAPYCKCTDGSADCGCKAIDTGKTIRLIGAIKYTSAVGTEVETREIKPVATH